MRTKVDVGEDLAEVGFLRKLRFLNIFFQEIVALGSEKRTLKPTLKIYWSLGRAE